jgi:hypothetical protein
MTYFILFVFIVTALVRYFCLVRPYKGYAVRLLDLASIAFVTLTALGASWAWALAGLALMLFDVVRKWDLVVRNLRELT